MYRHFLVPLHSGDLAFDVVGRALAVARPLGARVSFFHAVIDGDDAQADGRLQPLHAAELRDSQRTGRARELLSRAEAGARALGVPCDARWSRSRCAATATVRAAHALGCDVLFMATSPGDMTDAAVSTLTLSVLASAGIPVLVAPTLPPSKEHRALAVIRDEHRAIAAVIHACTSLFAAARDAEDAVDPAAVRAALTCLRSAPLGLHHEKEAKHLFARLRMRTPELSTELDELERQHTRDETLLDELSMRLALLEDAGGQPLRVAATRSLEDAMTRFAELHWEHMGREEAVVLPAARELLDPEDWEHLNAVFAHAPGGGIQLDFRPLLARLG